MVGCVQMIQPSMPPKDPSLEELLSLYQQETKAIPPLKGLMKATLTDKVEKGFWAKWRSRNGAIEIDGYNLFGGTLFNLKVAGSEIALASSENNFKGNREALAQYLATHHSEIRMEWVSLLDTIARGGLPDFTQPDRPILEKEDNHIVLSFVNGHDHLTRKVWIERNHLRVSRAIFFNGEGHQNAIMLFDDYRRVDKTLFPFSIRMEARGEHETDRRQMEIVFKELKALIE